MFTVTGVIKELCRPNVYNLNYFSIDILTGQIQSYTSVRTGSIHFLDVCCTDREESMEK